MEAAGGGYSMKEREFVSAKERELKSLEGTRPRWLGGSVEKRRGRLFMNRKEMRGRKGTRLGRVRARCPWRGGRESIAYSGVNSLRD